MLNHDELEANRMNMKPKARQQKSYQTRKEDVNRQWFIFDAKGKTLGRFASEIANVLRGKHKSDFTPSIDGGDGVIVINADKIRVTGQKEAQKKYYEYSGYIGGLKETSFRRMMQKNPGYIITHAVKGMIPKTRIGKKMMTRLRISRGDEHGMTAQKPTKVNI